MDTSHPPSVHGWGITQTLAFVFDRLSDSIVPDDASRMRLGDASECEAGSVTSKG
jgi:hypothetical protein